MNERRNEGYWDRKNGGYYRNNKDKVLERSKKRYLKNRVELCRRSRLYYRNNKKKSLECNRKWKEKNPERVRKIKERYRISHREELLSKGREYSREHRKEQTEYKKKWRRKNPDKTKVEKLKGRFNLSMQDYKALIQNQKNMCGICSTEFCNNHKNVRYPCIDHDHNTGKIRGLLCRKCNAGIGGFKDDPVLLKKALSWSQRIGVRYPFRKYRRDRFSKYGLDLDQYKEILLQQKGRCGICDRDISTINNIDHNHRTGNVRGLLCPRCNRSLGFIEDINFLKALEWVTKKGGL